MSRSSEPPTEPRSTGRGRATALHVLVGLLLAACWVLIPVLAGGSDSNVPLLLGLFSLPAGLVWVIPALAGRGPVRPPSRPAGSGRPLAHGVAAVLATGAWLATTVVLCVVAEFAVWKSANTSLAPAFGVVGFLGLVGSTFGLHRTLAREAPGWIALATSAGTTVAGCAVLYVVAAVLGPTSPAEALLLGILVVGGPLLLAVVGVVLVRRAQRRRAPV